MGLRVPVWARQSSSHTASANSSATSRWLRRRRMSVGAQGLAALGTQQVVLYLPPLSIDAYPGCRQQTKT
jgi:hypothetical protein